MAENSKREQIILYVIQQVKELERFRAVERILPTTEDLAGFASTQFPAIAVIGGYPEPVEHKHGRHAGNVDKFISKLEVGLWCYENINKDADSRLSDLADELWAKLWEDQTRGGLVIESLLSFEPRPLYLRPYISFVLNLNMRYVHGIGGI